MLTNLEAFCADSSKPLHQRFTAAAMLFCVKMRMKPFFGLVRGMTSKQWFDLWISTIRDSGGEDCRCVFPDYKLGNDGALT